MKLYFFLVVVFAFFSFLEVSLKKNNILKVLNFLLFNILLFLFMFNRENADYNNYVKAFNEKLNNGEMEKGYLTLVEIVKSLNGNHNWIIILTSILVFFFLIYKKSYYSITFLFLYLISNFLYDLNQIRNILMISLIYITLEYLKKKKYKKVILLYIVAITIHKLACIYLLFYLLYFLLEKKYKKVIEKIFICLLFLIPIYFLFPEVIEKILQILSGRNSYFKGVNLGYLVSSFQVIIDFILLKLLYEEKDDSNIYVKFFIFTFLFFPICFISKELYTRIYRNSLFAKWYYVLNKMKNKNIFERNLILILLILNAGISFLVMYFRSNEFIVNLFSMISNVKIVF